MIVEAVRSGKLTPTEITPEIYPWHQAYQVLFGADYLGKLGRICPKWQLATTQDGYGHLTFLNNIFRFVDRFPVQTIRTDVVQVAKEFGGEGWKRYGLVTECWKDIQARRDPRIRIRESMQTAGTVDKVIGRLAILVIDSLDGLDCAPATIKRNGLLSLTEAATKYNYASWFKILIPKIMATPYHYLVEGSLVYPNLQHVYKKLQGYPDVLFAPHPALARGLESRKLYLRLIKQIKCNATSLIVVSDPGHLDENLFPFVVKAGNGKKVYYLVATQEVADSMVQKWGVKREKVFVTGTPSPVEDYQEVAEKINHPEKHLLLGVSGTGTGLSAIYRSISEISQDAHNLQDCVVDVFLGHFEPGFKDKAGKGKSIQEVVDLCNEQALVLANKGITLKIHYTCGDFAQAAATKLDLLRKATITFANAGEAPLMSGLGTAVVLLACSARHELLNAVHGISAGRAIMAPLAWVSQEMKDRWHVKTDDQPGLTSDFTTFPQMLRWLLGRDDTHITNWADSPARRMMVTSMNQTDLTVPMMTALAIAASLYGDISPELNRRIREVIEATRHGGVV